MKSPREIILERHAASRPALDAMRRRLLQDLENHPKPSWHAVLEGLGNLIRELYVPCRHWWIGCAATWSILAVIHLALGAAPSHIHPSPTRIAKELQPWLHEQQRLRAELLNLQGAETPASHRMPEKPEPSQGQQPGAKSGYLSRPHSQAYV